MFRFRQCTQVRGPGCGRSGGCDAAQFPPDEWQVHDDCPQPWGLAASLRSTHRHGCAACSRQSSTHAIAALLVQPVMTEIPSVAVRPAPYPSYRFAMNAVGRTKLGGTPSPVVLRREVRRNDAIEADGTIVTFGSGDPGSHAARDSPQGAPAKKMVTSRAIPARVAANALTRRFA